MIVDRPLFGIMLMLGFCALAPLGDAIAKLLADTIPLLQLLIVRFAVQALLLLPIVWWNGHSLRMTRPVFMLTTIRTALHIAGIAAMFTSLRFLPLADAIAIAFVMPFILLVLARMFLGEEIGMFRIVACVVGFAGTLLVIQPNFYEVGLPALLPLLVALIFALFMLTTRQLAKQVDPISLQATSGVMATGGLVLIYLAGTNTGFTSLEFVVPDFRDGLLLAAIGVIGTIAHLLMTGSLRFAPAATLVPMQYLEIPVATFFGWLIFADLPNGLAAIGIVITSAAGLYIVFRERRAPQLGPEV